jgi:tRNA dimethylallyltransferase
METERPVLHVLTGCTAVGKTEWALRWAEEHGAEILSCDSQLFYRGMDIGTAKPTAAEQSRVRHHLIDCCDVRESMDVARYVELARAALSDIASRGRSGLVVGGSGFYLKAFFGPVADGVAVSVEMRQEVAALPPAAVVARLRALNPLGLEGLDLANPRRVVRALERCLASGKTWDELVYDFSRQPSPFAAWAPKLTVIERDPAELERRIVGRVQAMLAGGLVDEVRQLLGRGLRDNPSAARAIGYREVIDVLDGRLPVHALPDEIAQNTRRLVKKQRTWFRTQLPPHAVIDAGHLTETATLFGA